MEWRETRAGDPLGGGGATTPDPWSARRSRSGLRMWMAGMEVGQRPHGTDHTSDMNLQGRVCSMSRRGAAGALVSGARTVQV